MFWAATRTFVLARRSTVRARDVNGGQMTTSTTSSCSAARGRKASRNTAASGRVLCIFQLAAQIGFRGGIELYLSPIAYCLRLRNRAAPRRRGAPGPPATRGMRRLRWRSSRFGRPARTRPGLRPSPHRRQPSCRAHRDRKSTRLNSSHTVISYAVFCLKKKKKTYIVHIQKKKKKKKTKKNKNKQNN